MRVRIPSHLAYGSCLGSVQPPALSGTFFVKGTLRLRPGQTAEWLPEGELVSGDIYVDDNPAGLLRYASDFAVYKPRADVLIVGHGHVPRGKTATGLRVGLTVGTLTKSLDVFGQHPAQLDYAADKRFESFALGYDVAFGGPGFARNPLGRGFDRVTPPLVFAAGGKAEEPVGFGPIPAAWPQRQSLLGSFAGDYMEARWPWFPADFDWGFFNAAPRDQQIEGYLRGDEEVVLSHLDPDFPMLRSRLPGVRVRCFVTDRVDGAPRIREPRMQLDTLWIDAATLTMVLVWRGLLDVQSSKMREVEEILVVEEALKTEQRPHAHHLRAALAAEAEIEEPEEHVAPAAAADDDEQFEAQFAAMDRDFAALEEKAAAAEKELLATAAEQPEAVAALKKSAQAPGEVVADLDAVAKELADAASSNPEHAVALQKPDLAAFASAKAELESFKREMAELEAELQAEADTARVDVEALAASGESMADMNLAGLDLSKLDLGRSDMSGVSAIGVNFSGSDLAGACLRNADLTESNLEGADLSGAILDGADLTRAKLAGAKLTGASMIAARLAGLELAGADLSGCVASEADFSGSNLAGAILQGDFTEAGFERCKLADAQMAGGVFARARFRGAVAPGIDCSDADLRGLQADEGADFSGARLTGADATNGIFDGSNMDGADFTQAKLAGAQLEGTFLRGANFDRADLTGAMLDGANMQGAIATNANFLRASFEGTDVTRATFEGSNLYEAGLWLAKPGQTVIRGANLKGTLWDGAK